MNDWCPPRLAVPLRRVLIQVVQNFVHNIEIDLFAPCLVSTKQGIEAQVVDVPRNTFTAHQNPFQSSVGKQRCSPITRYPKPVFDVPNDFFPRKRFQPAQD